MRKAGELTEEDEDFVRFVVMKIAAEVTRQALADASFALLGKSVDVDKFDSSREGAEELGKQLGEPRVNAKGDHK